MNAPRHLTYLNPSIKVTSHMLISIILSMGLLYLITSSVSGELGEEIQILDESESHSVSWGDIDGDGDLDLAVSNFGKANQIYENQDGELMSAPHLWSPGAPHLDTTSLAWGDVDGDGDLDVAEGSFNGQHRIYLNENEIGRAHV